MLAAARCASRAEEEEEEEEEEEGPEPMEEEGDQEDAAPPPPPPPSIQSLPDELLVKVFAQLPVEDLAWRVSNVCTRWARVAHDAEVWRGKVYRPASSIPCARIAECLRRAPKLEGLSISTFASVETVRHVCKSLNTYSHNIKHLSLPIDVSRSFPIKNVLCEKQDSLVTLNLRFSETVVLSEFAEVYSAEILTCVGMCRNLRSLTLSGVIVSDTVAFEAVACGCPKLKMLNIQNCDMHTRNSLECLLKREFDTITSLSLSWNFEGDQGTLPLVAKYCKKLEKLSICEPEKLFGCRVTCHDVAALRHMTCLRELSMPCVKDDVLEDFLELFECGLFKNLEKLDFSYNPWVKNVLLVSIISNCSNLKSLHLQCCYELTSCAFQSISLLKDLKELNLEGCVGLRDEAISHIVKCRSLTYLNVNRIFAFTRLPLIQCCKCLKHLRELHIIVHHVYEDDLKDIPHHLRLFLNCMNGCQQALQQIVQDA